jgi:hypothetical protein
MESNYGTEGIELMAAGWGAGVVAAIVLLLGIVLLLISSSQGSLGVAALGLIGVGAAGEVLPLVRARQASRAGRLWRNGRAFQR